MTYTIWQVSPKNYIHSRCFDEVAQALRESFRELGHKCEIVTDGKKCRGTAIVLGAHLLTPLDFLPDDMIIYNLEQVGSTWMNPAYINLMKHWPVWDYCEGNIQELLKFGIAAKLCRVGYSPCLTRIKSAEDQDIDVLFIGSLNERREGILRTLASVGLKIKGVFGVYGEERDALIARAKVVLNMHYWPAKTFEVVRCSYLLANKKCVVSEWGSDLMMELEFKGIVFTDYDNLSDMCKVYVINDQLRAERAYMGFEGFKKMKQTDYLAAVL